jgi:hypothetical protein
MIYFGNKCITARNDTLLNKLHPTVYRLELGEPRFGLPETAIVKQQKHEREAEFYDEISALTKLQKLQDTVIPTLFGECSFNGRLALIISGIKGITLRDLAKLAESSVEEKTLQFHLEEAFKEFYKFGAEHYDLNLGNFLLCDNGEVVVIDLKEVEFHPPSPLPPTDVGSLERVFFDRLSGGCWLGQDHIRLTSLVFAEVFLRSLPFIITVTAVSACGWQLFKGARTSLVSIGSCSCTEFCRHTTYLYTSQASK